jgi:V/A-type H+-transporting ATPase subunit D
MPDGGEILATRVAFLELKDERRLIQEGYELLDEKRVLLATEIMRQLRHLGALREQFARLEPVALEALEAAVAMHGFDKLTVEPKLDLAPAQVVVHEQAFLGLRLVEASLDDRGAPPGPEARPTTPEARACAAASSVASSDCSAA